MWRFLTSSLPGLMVIFVAAVIGYFVLLAPQAPAEQPAADEIADHTANCAVCRLPLYGEKATPSKHGHDRHNFDAAADSTR